MLPTFTLPDEALSEKLKAFRSEGVCTLKFPEVPSKEV